MRHRYVILAVVFLCILAVIVGVAQATAQSAPAQGEATPSFTVPPADAALYGRVLTARTHREDGHIVTDFVIHPYLALGLPRDALTVRVDGGTLGNVGMAATHTPHLRQGENVFLFLTRFNGTWRVWGGEQGHFAVRDGWAVREAPPASYPLITLVEKTRQRLEAAGATVSLPVGWRTLLPRPSARPPRSPFPQTFVYNGIHWPGPNPMGEVYRVNTTTNEVAPAAFLQAVRNAAANWTNVGCSYFVFPYGGTTTVQTVGNDGTNVVVWGALPAGILGRTTYWYYTDSGEIVEADMMLNTLYDWAAGNTVPSGRFDVESVVLHEFGHWLSLGHDSEPAAVMYAGLPPGVKKRKLHASDIAGICHIYPRQQATPTPTPTPTRTPTPTPRATSPATSTPSPTPLPTRTPTHPVPTASPSRTPTSTPTATPTAPGVKWSGGGTILPPQGGPISLRYEGIHPPVPFSVRVEGAARLAEGKEHFETVLYRNAGTCTFRLEPAGDVVASDVFTFTVQVDTLRLVKTGTIGEGHRMYVPMIGQNGPALVPRLGDTDRFFDACQAHIVTRVFVDENGDGKREPREPDLGGVLVELWSRGERVKSLLSDVRGEAVFPNVEEGPYALTVVLPRGRTLSTPARYFLQVAGADVYGPYFFGVLP